MSTSAPPRPVPWRTIWAVIASVLLTIVLIEVVQRLAHVITLLVIAVFFAVVLHPPVTFLDRRLPGRRALATFIVFLLGMGVIGGMMYTFIRPLAEQTSESVDNFPKYVADAEAGRGPIGRVLNRYDLDERLEENKPKIEKFRNDLGGKALTFVGTIASTLFGIVTILVMTFLMLLEGPRIVETGLNLFEDPIRRDRVRKVAGDCARAVTGYVAGNLLISLVAGVATFIALSVIGVPFQGVLSLWVAFADLIPLVGATLGAIPAVLVAFLDSPTSGFLTLGFFVIYQQFENHVLQITIMSRTVSLNPLTVLTSVLIGVELLGILGALLAIPVAGIIQVIARDIYDERRHRLKPEPTIGADEIPASEVPPPPPLDDDSVELKGRLDDEVPSSLMPPAAPSSNDAGKDD